MTINKERSKQTNRKQTYHDYALLLEVNVDDALLVGTLQTGRIIVFIGNDQRHILRDSKQSTAVVAASYGRFRPTDHGTDELEVEARRDFTIEACSSHQATGIVRRQKLGDTFSSVFFMLRQNDISKLD